MTAAERPSILVIAGPTGVGKTALAVELCLRLNGEIVGADSVQIYRGLSIGSGKPDVAELRGVPHHLIDVLEADAEVDAARYAALATEAIADIDGRGRLPVVVGGTGLWLRALLRGLLSLPPVDHTLRRHLEAEWERLGAEEAFLRLAQIDPLSAKSLHPNDKLRVVRALEVHAQTGMALGELRRQHALGSPRYHSLGYFVDLPRAMYRKRITERVQAMIQAGFVQEVDGLLSQYPQPPRSLHSVGYRQVVDHLVRGEPDAAALPEAIIKATLLYARRQRTWFGSDPSVPNPVTPEQLLADRQLKRIRTHLDRG